MGKWIGAAGICINQKGQLLMVLQGKPEERKAWAVPSGGLEKGETIAWAVPSGGLEKGETIEECCLREFNEETGYDIRIVKPLFIKEGISYDINVEIHYFTVEIIGGTAQIQDPDQLIYDISWKSADEVMTLELSFAEDRDLLINLINGNFNSLK